EVTNSMFSTWYPLLRHSTFKSAVLKPLAPEFLSYLQTDGIFLPDNEATPQYGSRIDAVDSDSDWSDDEPDVHVNLDSTSAEIRSALKELGGSVFPRMNWSAPSDAMWMATGNTLQCFSASEVYLLLKSSDKITRDLVGARYEGVAVSVEPELVLRQWCNLLPSMEFRCFVREQELVAVSQIDLQHYEFLEDMAALIADKISAFFQDKIREVFPSTSYCFDVYVTRNMDQVYVIDFEPWTHSVDSGLFGWQELVQAAGFLGLRLFPKNVNALAHFSGKYSQSRFPVELTADAYQKSMADLIEKMAAGTAS
ncbi:D123-domain-containing protein, partial [Linderina pennispora]